MSEDKKYNGYTNYETWLVALWLDNEPYTQEAMSEKAEELVEAMEDIFDVDEVSAVHREFGDFINDLVGETQELPTTGLCADLVNAALREVDYSDIAESQMADALHTRREVEKKGE